MSATDAAGGPARHSWLAALVADPVAEFARLIAGTARIAPYTRAEPEDAVAMMLGGLAPDDPARAALDAGAGAWLEAARRAGTADLSPASLDPAIASAMAALSVVRRAQLPVTAADLRDRYPLWMSWAEGRVLAPARDLRGEFLLTLAATQRLIHHAGQQPLVGLWLDICRLSGPEGRYPAGYIRIGLAGLRGLPPAIGDVELLCVQGLRGWAAAQHPARVEFLRQWRMLRALYPRAPAFWRGLVQPLLDAEGYGAAPFLRWWQQEVGGTAANEPPRTARHAEPPPRERHEALQQSLPTAEWGAVERDVRRLLSDHRAYADKTGETHFAVRTACNIGMRLLRCRTEPAASRLAQELSRAALSYQPDHVYAWALLRDALEQSGAVAAAECIGWEAIRRFPDNPQWYTQLAFLFGAAEGRTAEALALLAEAAEFFPEDPVVFGETGELLLLDGRPEEALQALRRVQTLAPEDTYVRVVERLAAGDEVQPSSTLTERSAPDAQAEAEAAADPWLQELTRGGRTRRALHRHGIAGKAEAAEADLCGVLAEDPNFAPAAYLRAAWTTGVPVTDTALGVAIAEAIRLRDATRLDAPGYEAARPYRLILGALQNGDAGETARSDLLGWARATPPPPGAVAAPLHGLLSPAARASDDPAAFAGAVLADAGRHLLIIAERAAFSSLARAA